MISLASNSCLLHRLSVASKSTMNVWKLPWGPLVDDSALYKYAASTKFEWFLEAQETKKTFSDMRRFKIRGWLNF